MKICLCMIVKDEAQVIERCLKSVPFVDYLYIADTGSSDNTIEEIERVWKEMGRDRVHMQLWKDEWVDYSHNRNHVLSRARSLLEKDDFIFVMDADDVWDDVDKPVKKVFDLLRDVDVVTCSYELNEFEWRRNTFWRAGAKVEYVGAAHELATWKEVRPPVVFHAPFNIRCNVGMPYQGKDYFLKIAALLEKDPEEPRSVFYTAQSYQCAGELEKAHEAYMRRVQMGGNQQENYVSWMELGKMTDDPGCYMQAMKIDLTRPEAWYYTALWYHKIGVHLIALELVRRGLSCSPEGALFLDKTIIGMLKQLQIILTRNARAAKKWVQTPGAEYSQELLDLANEPLGYCGPAIVKLQE